MPRILTTPISGSQCIGDSLPIINNNYEALDTVVYALSTNTIAVSSTATVTPVLLPSTTSFPWTKTLTANVNDNSITTAKLASGSVGTIQLSSGAVTTTKVATDAITYSRLATLSSVGTLLAEAVQPRLAKAWVIFNGTTATPLISSSYNITSVTKTGTGFYNINLAPGAVSNNRYLITGQPMDVAGQDNNVGGIIYLSDVLTKTTSVAQIKVTSTTTDGLYDSPAVHVIIFGD